MQNSYLIVLAVALAMAPLALAHEPMGAPKLHCETAAEWAVHDYGPPAPGFLIWTFIDGSASDCDGTTSVTPVIDTQDPLNSDIYVDPPVADYDGHSEYARGGAWILVDSGLGVPSASPDIGAGTLYCYGAEGHHPRYGPFVVRDLYFESGVEFSVYSDTVDLLGDGEGCGDFESDNGADCIDTCKVTFLPGLDGSYQVYVLGTQGHVITVT